MSIFPVTNEETLQAAYDRIEELWDCEEGSKEQDDLEALVLLVNAYEEKHHPVPMPTPAEAIKFAMEQLGLKQKDVTGKDKLGAKSRVSELLRGKRNPTGDQIRAAFHQLRVPAEVLLQENG